MRTGKINRDSAALFIIDIQEGLLPVIPRHEKIISNVNKLIRGCQALNVPVIVTEQYPKGLKKTSPKIELPAGQKIIEKNCFSCFLSEEIDSFLQSRRIESIILAGMESHICVLKTAIDALDNVYDVHVVADAIGSRTFENKAIAIERMRQSGAFIVSAEMVLFQMMNSSKDIEFKQISALIK